SRSWGLRSWTTSAGWNTTPEPISHRHRWATKLRTMSVMRNEQWEGRYMRGNAGGHHHVLWLLNGHQEPGGNHTLGPSRNDTVPPITSRQIASTSGERSHRPCWIGAR